MIILHTDKEIEKEVCGYGNPLDIIHSFNDMKIGEKYSLYLSLVTSGEIGQTKELVHKTYSVEEEISKIVKNNELREDKE